MTEEYEQFKKACQEADRKCRRDEVEFRRWYIETFGIEARRRADKATARFLIDIKGLFKR